MSTSELHLYEGMYIISAKLSDDARKKALDKITSGIEKHGGKVIKVHDQGRKRLAYEIESNREGHYYIIYFEIASNLIKELWQEYHLSEDLIRFMTIKVEQVMETIEFKELNISS